MIRVEGMIKAKAEGSPAQPDLQDLQDPQVPRDRKDYKARQGPAE
jgi:hypothetical protein